MASQGSRYCVFCGNPANSREHLLPDWLQNVLPSDEPSVTWREVGGVKTSWETKRFSGKVRIVCEECNHGWMSQLENVAKGVLAPAITRSALPHPFDLRAQWIAANWAIKTCYVFQALAPERIALVAGERQTAPPRSASFSVLITGRSKTLATRSTCRNL